MNQPIDTPVNLGNEFSQINYSLLIDAVLLVAGVIFILYIIHRITHPEEETLEDFQKLGRRLLYSFLVGFIIIFFPWEDILSPFLYDAAKKHIWAGEVLIPILLALGVALVSIFYSSGPWYRFYARFQRLGIRDAKPSRMGRRTERDKFWADLLIGARKRVILSGATLGGWFSGSLWEDLERELASVLAHVAENDGFEIFVPHPNENGFKLRVDDESTAPSKTEKEQIPRDRLKRAQERIKGTLLQLAKLFDDESIKGYIEDKTLRIYIYTGTPVSVQCIDEDIFFVPYLPQIKDSECPEIEMSRGGEFAQTIMASLNGLRRDATLIKTRSEIDEIISELEDQIEKHEREAENADE